MSNNVIAGTGTDGATALPVANSIDATQDYLPIYTASAGATQAINRNTYLGLSSTPVGLTDSQTLTNKILTAPTLSSPVLSGTITGTYTIGGTPTFPSSVVTLTGSQTLTNKILTSPTINAPTITNATLSTDAITGFSASTTGSIYGMSVASAAFTTSNIIPSASIQANAITTAKLATGSNFQPATVAKNPYKFNVYRNASLANATGFALVTFDTALFDTGSNYNTSTGKFTAPIAGFYSFSTSIQVTTGAFTYQVAIYLNGSAVAYGNLIPIPGSSGVGLSASCLLSLSANDYIQVYSYTTNSGGLGISTGANTSYFAGYLVSAT